MKKIVHAMDRDSCTIALYHLEKQREGGGGLTVKGFEVIGREPSTFLQYSEKDEATIAIITTNNLLPSRSCWMKISALQLENVPFFLFCKRSSTREERRILRQIATKLNQKKNV